MELTALRMPAEYGGTGADLVTQAIAVEELARADASASLHVPHLQARDAAGHELRLRGAEAEVPPADRHRARSRPATACRRPTPAATWRR